MTFRPALALLVLLTTLSAAAIVGGCSKDKGTNPPATTPESFDSGNLVIATPFTHIFSASIATMTTFSYRCKYHSGSPFNMTGSVVVDPASSNTSASVAVADYSFTPKTVTVKPGSTVTWTQSSGTTHTVTRP